MVAFPAFPTHLPFTSLFCAAGCDVCGFPTSAAGRQEPNPRLSSHIGARLGKQGFDGSASVPEQDAPRKPSFAGTAWLFLGVQKVR